MRKFFCFFVAVCTLLTAVGAAAEGAPVLFGSLPGEAPFEQVQRAEQPPFQPDAALLEIDVLGIGLGDSIVVRCGGETMLIDGGESHDLPTLLRFMADNGIDGFDTLFLTHAHDDHLQAQQRLVARGCRVGRVVSPYGAENNGALWRAYREKLDQAGIPHEQVQNGDVITLGGAELTVFINPDTSLATNNRSAAAMLRFGGASAFLAADIGGATQEYFLREYGADAL